MSIQFAPPAPERSDGRVRSSIAWILIAVITLLVLGGLGSASFAGYRIFKAEEVSRLDTMGSAMSEQAAIGLSLPLWNFDEIQTRQTIESIMRLEVVRGVVVRQGTKRDLFLAVQRDSAGSIVRWETPTPRPKERAYRRPVVFASDTIGQVEVVVTERPLQERLSKLRISLWTVVILVGLLLSGSLHLLLWRIALRPILILEEYSRRMDDGFALDLADVGGFRGELDSLRWSIVRMIKLLAERFEHLREETKQHKESEQKFRTLVDTIPDLIWLKDSQGVYLSCNRMFEHFFGASEQEIVGKSDFDFVSHELAEAFRENDRKAMKAGLPSFNEETVTFAADGRTVLLETTKTPMFDSEGKLVGVLGVGRDITARRHAENERRELQVRMSNAQRLEALGVLVAGVAHNFNNVLAVILANASLRAELTREEVDRESFQMISTACVRGRDLVKSLLQFARPSISNESPLELHPLLSEVRCLLENTTRNRIRMVEKFTAEDVWILGDAGALTNSFMNLFFNAIDAMSNGGTIVVSTRMGDGEFVEILVQDDGPGMPTEILDRVMEPFFTTKEVGRGTGLGLSMTHGVVQVHGGTMHIESQVGRGVLVCIRLPRISRPAKTPPTDADGVAGPLHVLLVDDDPDVRYLVGRMLKSGGHRVTSVAGGEEAIEQVRAGLAPDLVITDQNMPGMNGIQTMEGLRALRPDLPILVSSGQLDIQEWPCFRNPGVGVIPKPFELRELRAKLNSLLAG